MPGFLLHVAASIQCFHQAPVLTFPTQTRVLVGGRPVATTLNQLVVMPGLCLFTPPGSPKMQPCVLVQWQLLSTRLFVDGQPALLQSGPGFGAGVCQSAEQVPQGAPVVSSMQLRVSAM